MRIDTVFVPLALVVSIVNGLPYQSSSSVRDVIKELMVVEANKEGILHLGDDGVLRIFNSEWKVLDYAPLDPTQIGEYIGITNPGATVPQVDGRRVKVEHLSKPSQAILADATAIVRKSMARKDTTPVNENVLHRRGCQSFICFTTGFCEGIGCFACFGSTCF